MTQSFNTILALAALTGATAHATLYRHGEWDLEAHRVVISYILVLAGAITLQNSNVLDNLGVLAPPHWAVKVVGCHILGIYISMLLYRGLFHRLSKFPGPTFAKLSNFYVTFLSARRFKLHREIEEFHRRYGDYVRIGPTELSISDPSAIKSIYSANSKTSKGPWYTVLEPRVTLQMTRDKQDHSRRRRIWDQGFSTRALRDYEPRVSRYTEQLIQAIDRGVAVGKPMDVSRWFSYYSFDVMGDLSFGKAFDMLVQGRDAYILKEVHAFLKMIGLFARLTWMFPLFKRVPGVNASMVRYWDWVVEQVDWRIQQSVCFYASVLLLIRVWNTPKHLDIFSWILKAFENGPKTKQDRLDLEGDANLIIIAGSDTISATLTNLFFHLATDKTLYKTLQAELDALPELSYDNLTNVKLIDAVVNETLRLHPAVPSGTQRLTPPEGLMVGERWIPGGVMVCVPSYTVFRDERAFSHPTEFIPERWTTRPELVKQPSAFIPFNGGPYTCVGKNLAMMELRRVTAELLTRYDIDLAPGQSAEAFLEGGRDFFTLSTGPLELVFTPRE